MVASIPPKSAPADYTRFFVNNAISWYETQGLDATLAYYNREESIDGQWNVFIIDENDLVIGRPDAHRLGLDLKGWVGTDANEYNFGPDMLSATEDGKWVSYVYRNPESGGIGPDHTGALEYKHVWTVRHDGLLFASGWYISANCRRRSDSRSQPFCSSISASRPLMRSWAAARAMAASAGAARGAAVRQERNSSRTAASICSSPVGSLSAGSRPEATQRETVEGRTEALDVASTAFIPTPLCIAQLRRCVHFDAGRCHWGQSPPAAFFSGGVGG